MKIGCISDTHGLHRSVTVPDCDLLIHAGDFMASGKNFTEIVDFNNWLNHQPIENIVCIAGNHDRSFEAAPGLAHGMLNTPVYLENSGVIIGGLKFWGSPVTPEFCNWAFNVERGEAIRRYWDLIPDDLDVLITHGPPYGVLDQLYGKGEHLGCEELLKAVEAKRPRLHVFGHIHSGHGVAHNEHTRFVNASLLDERYNVRYEPIVEVLDPR